MWNSGGIADWFQTLMMISSWFSPNRPRPHFRLSSLWLVSSVKWIYSVSCHYLSFLAVCHIRLSPCRLTRKRLCFITYLSRSGVGLARLDLSPAALSLHFCPLLASVLAPFPMGGSSGSSIFVTSQQPGWGGGSHFESRPSDICTQACHGHMPLVLTFVFYFCLQLSENW